MSANFIAADTRLSSAKQIPTSVPEVNWYDESEPLKRHTRVLLVKPYQPTPAVAESPPMGLLCLSASLKQAFGDKIDIKVLDMKLYRQQPEKIIAALREYDADIIGVSALNCEARASKEIAHYAKQTKPSILTVLGGPYSHRRGMEILSSSEFDWAVSGPGDRVFAQAIRRFINDTPLQEDIPGLDYKAANNTIHLAKAQDFIDDLDSLPVPDWHHIDFDLYSKRGSGMSMQKGKRYALLFTSRGCPYLCNYCHDVFTKKFKFQSAERVLQEVEYLHTNFGITEFQVIDDIFNLHKPRLKQIMHEVHRRWAGKIVFCFPNGLRGDIMDEDVLNDLKLGGTYAMAVAIETATPRLQTLVEKHLNIEKTRQIIEWADQRKIMVKGLFMFGFPTETPEELRSTMDFALQSNLTIAQFFSVIPQPETPLYALAEKEDRESLLQANLDDETGQIFYTEGAPSWYERSYGFPLRSFITTGYLKFYLAPKRIRRMATRVPFRSILQTGTQFILMIIRSLINNARSSFQQTPVKES